MSRVYTYIQPTNKCSSQNVDTLNLATKNELDQGVQDAKDYTDKEIQKLNNEIGHTHINKSLLDKFTESNGDLFFNGKNLSGIYFEEVQG